VLGILTIVGLGQNHLANKQLWDDNRQLHLNTERKLMALQEDKSEELRTHPPSRGTERDSTIALLGSTRQSGFPQHTLYTDCEWN
jgi:hypothetical protein